MRYAAPIKVTVSDSETGAVLDETVITDDYVLITTGNRYLKHVGIMGSTHMLAVAVSQEPSAPPSKTDGADE